ncbi:MAG: bifunctional diaminohydroxyphosphoribosylaminopyrimidine deaminase/5-amino-6-(5-phosphoribosylamino)uracil reductase RibD [Bacteroidota bacterium]
MNEIDQKYMQRCMELARLGAGSVAPNPMVGAVLVHAGRIIGEGYHQQYGQAHAEVNCINSVPEADQVLISSSTLYVSLEPCAHFGKTPPCSDLIIRNGIKKVVIGCRDPFMEVDGKGIEKLQQAGVEVITGIAEAACKELNRRFFCMVQKKRPYVILKWAQTANGMIAGNSSERVLISNEYSNHLVHQWRSEEAAILVGTNTAMHDDPSLTNRLWTGNSPVRMVLDMHLRLPKSLQLFNPQQTTVVINAQKEAVEGNIVYKKAEASDAVVKQILSIAYQLQLQSILVEGGAQLLQSFISEGFWDEARIITNTTLTIANGLPAPTLAKEVLMQKQQLQNDTITFFTN